MKMLGLVIVSVMLGLAILGALAGKQTGRASPTLADYRYSEPFRGSKVGNTLARACGDCHSDQTNWPWYSHIAPISWWIEIHVREGRAQLNFSQWKTYSPRHQRDQLELICGVILAAKMPPKAYTALHPEARLAPQDKQLVCVWAKAEVEHER